MKPIADQSLATFTAAVAERQPTPGGGAAAAASAAIAAALGAMAARYTTGKRYQDQEAAATALAEQCDALRQEFLTLAEADAQAYAQVRSLKREQASTTAISRAEAEASAIPAQLITHCHTLASALSTFAPICNPWLLADLRAAVHLAAGAAQAGRQIMGAGEPSLAQQHQAKEELNAIAVLQQQIGSAVS